MKVFILINVIIEILAGIIFLLMPSAIPGAENLDVNGLTFVRMYGGGALAVGFYAFQTWRNMGSSDLVLGFLRTFGVFHVGVSIASYIGYQSGGADFLPVAILHGVLGVITLYFLFSK